MATFPHDLVQAQRDWITTYQALAATPRSNATTALRRRMLRLSVRIFCHPYWSAGPGRSSAGQVELRRQARSAEAHRAGEA
ncbi:hypothetical protein ACH4PU_30750 [Streptomyces sp. NPDC021100]|uniref:hypothetical protein n=1 Tax=Streptomyces sp. NPDC021100 TaxID=3365114 RepID=UPI0037A1DF05